MWWLSFGYADRNVRKVVVRFGGRDLYGWEIQILCYGNRFVSEFMVGQLRVLYHFISRDQKHTTHSERRTAIYREVLALRGYKLKCLWVLSLLQPYESVHSFDVDCFSLGVSLFENECRLRQEVVNAVETQYGKPFGTFSVSEIEWVFQFISVTKV